MTPEEVAAECLGWLHPSEGPKLYELGLTTVGFDSPMAEIGGYAGKSACWLGKAARNTNGLLYSVDWHRGSPEMDVGRECHHPEMVGMDGLFDSLPHFRANIRKAELEPWVVPVAGKSNIVGRFWSTQLSLLFIDGGHDDETVMNDYNLWGGWVVKGGWLLFHDTPIPGIDAAARRAVDEGFKFVDQIESLRVLRRP
jgi:MMP 1-O-methyltransferase